MNLYRIWQTVNYDYDTYDSAVVAASSEAEAELIHPSGTKTTPLNEWLDWCDLKYVNVELIGAATADTKPGVICSSFNAG